MNLFILGAIFTVLAARSLARPYGRDPSTEYADRLARLEEYGTSDDFVAAEHLGDPSTIDLEYLIAGKEEAARLEEYDPVVTEDSYDVAAPANVNADPEMLMVYSQNHLPALEKMMNEDAVENEMAMVYENPTDMIMTNEDAVENEMAMVYEDPTDMIMTNEDAVENEMAMVYEDPTDMIMTNEDAVENEMAMVYENPTDMIMMNEDAFENEMAESEMNEDAFENEMAESEMNEDAAILSEDAPGNMQSEDDEDMPAINEALSKINDYYRE